MPRPLTATASIVLYRNPPEEISTLMDCFLRVPATSRLYLIDNSPDDSLRSLAGSDGRVEYVFNNRNLGFGAGHNIAIDRSMQAGNKFHFVVNPDIYFKGDVITPMLDRITLDPTIGMMMPEVLHTDGSVQHLPKLLPNPLWMVWRKFKRPKAAYNRFIDRYELRNAPRDVEYNSPILSGCFTLLNLEAVREIGSYDDRFFMYFEDLDISRRMHEKFRTLYFPAVSVFHGYEGGANSDPRLFRIFLSSGIKYFNKWGWIADRKRIAMNREALNEIKNCRSRSQDQRALSPEI